MHRSTATWRRALPCAGAIAAAALLMSACANFDSDTEGAGDTVGVTLITRDSVDPYFVAMHKGAKENADQHDVELTVTSGRTDRDEAGQVEAIERAVAKGHKGILIAPNGEGVNSAITRARAAGLYVIALDAQPDRSEEADIAFAADTFEAGKLVGQWAAAQLGRRMATIALLDVPEDSPVSVDDTGAQGFLAGMGIDGSKPIGEEVERGEYTGGEYTIVCDEPTEGTEDASRVAMERCLAKDPGINVVYSANESGAGGAYAALKAAGKQGAVIVSVGGTCAGIEAVDGGTLGATAQLDPAKTAALGLAAIADVTRKKTTPTTSTGVSFFNTGVVLVTNEPVEGRSSITSDEAAEVCWG